MLSIAATAAATAVAGPALSPATPQPRLVKAAHEFEAQLMQELLKPLTSGSELDGEDGGLSSGANGTLGAFAAESLGKALSEQGGFGIATSIVRQLTAASNTKVTTEVTGNLHRNTPMKTYK